MNARERFLAALACQTVDRPPVWVMRQAGRYLPEYRALKEKHTFVEMVQTPELACEVTLQPLRRFALDAAILFSDILVIPEALGMPYRFRPEGGIAMEWRIETRADVARLSLEALEERLAYVPAALALVRQALGEETALLGFAGAPWTLATYMIEGGSSPDFARVQALLREAPEVVEALVEVLTQAVARYLTMQAGAGADALQIFDSWAGACPEAWRERLGLAPIRTILTRTNQALPIILFARGQMARVEALAATGADALGIDETVSLADIAARVPEQVALQGNLDPTLMSGPTDQVVEATTQLLTAMHGRPGHIVNLGHGIRPEARIENMTALTETVAHFRP